MFDDTYRAWHFLTGVYSALTGSPANGTAVSPIKLPSWRKSTDTTDLTSDWYLARQAVEQFQVNEQSGLSCRMGGRATFPGEGNRICAAPGRL